MPSPHEMLARLPNVEGASMAAVALELLPVSLSIVKAMRDDDGTITDFSIEYVNAAGSVLWADPSDAYGEALFDVVPAFREIGLFDRYVEVLETGEPYTEQGVRLSGTYEDVEYDLHRDVVATRLDDEHVMTVSHDRTAEHQASVRLVKMQETLSRRQQVERQIHEVNAGLVEDLVGVQIALDANDIVEARRHALEGARRAAKVVSGLRDVIRTGP